MKINKVFLFTLSCLFVISVIFNVFTTINFFREKEEIKNLSNKILTLEEKIESKNLNQEEKKIKEQENDKENTTTTQSTTTKPKEKVSTNPLIGKWQYTNGEDISTYEFKKDGTLWINGEYIDKYTEDTAICDNCLTHYGVHEIQFRVKDGVLYINFYKETQRRDVDRDGVEEVNVYWLISMGQFVKATKIG